MAINIDDIKHGRIVADEDTKEIASMLTGKRKAIVTVEESEDGSKHEVETGRYYASVAVQILMQPTDKSGKDLDHKPIPWTKWFARLEFEDRDTEQHDHYERNGNWPYMCDTLKTMGWDGKSISSIGKCLADTMNKRHVFSISLEKDDEATIKKYGPKIAFIRALRKPTDVKKFAAMFDEMLSADDGASGSFSDGGKDDLPF